VFRLIVRRPANQPVNQSATVGRSAASTPVCSRRRTSSVDGSGCPAAIACSIRSPTTVTGCRSSADGMASRPRAWSSSTCPSAWEANPPRRRGRRTPAASGGQFEPVVPDAVPPPGQPRAGRAPAAAGARGHGRSSGGRSIRWRSSGELHGQGGPAADRGWLPGLGLGKSRAAASAVSNHRRRWCGLVTRPPAVGRRGVRRRGDLIPGRVGVGPNNAGVRCGAVWRSCRLDWKSTAT
jgi:hypothetical protein